MWGFYFVYNPGITEILNMRGEGATLESSPLPPKKVLPRLRVSGKRKTVTICLVGGAKHTERNKVYLT